jgi:hypothetical protein
MTRQGKRRSRCFRAGWPGLQGGADSGNARNDSTASSAAAINSTPRPARRPSYHCAPAASSASASGRMRKLRLTSSRAATGCEREHRSSRRQARGCDRRQRSADRFPRSKPLPNRHRAAHRRSRSARTQVPGDPPQATPGRRRRPLWKNASCRELYRVASHAQMRSELPKLVGRRSRHLDSALGPDADRSEEQFRAGDTVPAKAVLDALGEKR